MSLGLKMFKYITFFTTCLLILDSLYTRANPVYNKRGCPPFKPFCNTVYQNGCYICPSDMNNPVNGGTDIAGHSSSNSGTTQSQTAKNVNQGNTGESLCDPLPLNCPPMMITIDANNCRICGGRGQPLSMNNNCPPIQWNCPIGNHIDRNGCFICDTKVPTTPSTTQTTATIPTTITITRSTTLTRLPTTTVQTTRSTTAPSTTPLVTTRKTTTMKTAMSTMPPSTPTTTLQTTKQPTITTSTLQTPKLPPITTTTITTIKTPTTTVTTPTTTVTTPTTTATTPTTTVTTPTTTPITTTRATTVATTSTIKTTTVAPAPVGHTIPPYPTTCFVCLDNAPDFCDILFVEKECQPPNNYCINEIKNLADGSKTINRTCGSFDRCFKDWYHGSSDKDVCQNFDENQYITLDFNCVYCCVKDGCNDPMKPYPDTLYLDK